MATTPPALPPDPSSAPGGGGGLMASIGGLLGGVFRQPPKPQLRAVPGKEQPEANDFYQRLAEGEAKAEAEFKRIYTEVKRDSLKGREIWERSWWKRLLYINGRQWIRYTPRNGWQDKRMSRWIPRPVTNICGATIVSIKAMLAAIDIGIRARPNGPDAENTITAEAVDTVEPSLKEEHEIAARLAEADFWTSALGCSWLHVFWNPDAEAHQEFVQAMACPQCQNLLHPLDIQEQKAPICPQCGVVPTNQYIPATDETGKPLGQSYSIGGAETRVVSPLELLFPQYFQTWRDVDRLIYLRWRPRTYYEGTDYENLISFSATPAEQTLQLFRQLANMSDLTTPTMLGGRQGGGDNKGEGCIEAELWIKPNAKYPKGLWGRLAGGRNGDAIVLRMPEKKITPGPLPYVNPQQKPLWCWVYYPYEFVGGRIYAKGAIDAVLGKQDAINRGDSMTELSMQRMSNPIWLEPKGAEVQRLTGEPGIIVRYSVTAGSNAKPERVEGMNPAQSVFALRAQHFEDAERLAGTQDVLKGMKPAGVEAFSALNLLVERSQSMFTSLFKARGRAYRDWFLIALELERSYGPHTRLIAAMGAGNSWTFQKVMKTDLAGSVNIVIEDGSDAPKTSLGRRAALQQAQTLGVPIAGDPDMMFQVLQMLGISQIAPTLDAQTRAAQVELQNYEQWIQTRQGPSPLQPEAWQNHQIYIAQLDRWASSDKIRKLTMNDPRVKSEITLYRMQHVIGQQNPFNMPVPMDPNSPGAMAAMGGAPGGAPGGPGAGPGPGGPAGAGRDMINSDQESGAVDTLPGAAPGGGGMGAPA